MPEELSPTQFKEAVEGILCNDSYFADSSEADFLILAPVAAVCVDSYGYWTENYAAWASALFGDATTRGFWGKVGAEVKRLSKVDAGGALMGGVGGMTGAFVGAGALSVFTAFQPYF